MNPQWKRLFMENVLTAECWIIDTHVSERLLRGSQRVEEKVSEYHLVADDTKQDLQPQNTAERLNL